MTTNARQPGGNNLENQINIETRDYDPETAEGELRYRLVEVKEKIEKLEKAQEISQELLETTI